MMLVNNNWEFCNTEEHVLNIIRENISSEFADECKALFVTGVKIMDLEDRISDLENEINDLNIQLDDYDTLNYKLNGYEDNIQSVEKEILNNREGESEYSMQKALESIKEI